MDGARDHSIAAEVGRHVVAFTGAAWQPQPEATLRIKLRPTSRSSDVDAFGFCTVAAKTSRGIVLSKQAILWEEDVDGFPSEHTPEAFLASARDPNMWRVVDHDCFALDDNGTYRESPPYVTLQHDVQVLAPTVANSAAVAQWLEALVSTMRDGKPSQPHELPWHRRSKLDAPHASIDAVSLHLGAKHGFFGEQTVQVAGGLFCEPLAPASTHSSAVRVKGFAYEDEPRPSAWTPEQCAAFDARCAAYHARTARVGARVAQLVGAWHAVPMTLG
jgi:hypothetical protein